MKKLNQKGQSLVEYLIIVALIGVSTLGVMRVLGQNISVQFAKVAEALGGTAEGSKQAEHVTEAMYKKKDLHDFFQGSNKHDSKNTSN